MLAYLRIRGLALVEDVALELSPGMNVLTGETGAGKSIIVDALSLIRGARARQDLIRDGADAAAVDAQFDIDDIAGVRCVLEEHGVPADGSQSLIVQRSVPRSGRSRCFVQATLTTQAALAHIGEQLVDICSQHEHHSLTHPSRHLELLDAYAKLDPAVAEYAESFQAWRESSAALDALRGRSAEATQRADYLRFQIEEIEGVAPDPGEHARLERRLALLRDAHGWAELADEARRVLYEDDDAVASRLARLADRTRRGRDSDLLEELEAQLDAARVACEEAASVAVRLARALEVEPGELERVADRLNELETLRRKHGVDADELGDRLASMRDELDSIEHSAEHIEALEARVAELHQRCSGQAKALGRARTRAAKQLGRELVAELEALHLAGASMEVVIESGGELGPRGRERASFLFSANRGEPVAPLSKVASGGELSRVLLAIKGVLATGDRVSTYVFDEIDAGVGGAVAESIGRRLRRASADHQVVCITHLPQIAAFADAHYRIDKQRKAKRTITRATKLSAAERVDELARMLGGARVSSSARAHAQQLLAEAASVSAPSASR